jgi:hypothetical protein
MITAATTDPASLLIYISVPGLIVPDLPYVTAHALWSEAKKNNLELVFPSCVIHQQASISKSLHYRYRTQKVGNKVYQSDIQLMYSGAAHNTSHTRRKNERNHESFGRVHLPGRFQNMQIHPVHSKLPAPPNTAFSNLTVLCR